MRGLHLAAFAALALATRAADEIEARPEAEKRPRERPPVRYADSRPTWTTLPHQGEREKARRRRKMQSTQ